ncbi:TraB/GumN family protein [Candidatus Nitrospira salsa]
MRFQQQPGSLFRLILIALTLQLLLPHSLQANDVGQTHATSCLWSVTSGPNTIYLLGSIHVLKQENYPLHDTINQAFESASHLVFEVNLDEISSPLTQKRSLTKGLYTDGRTLRDALSPGNFAFTKSKLKNRGYSIEMFNRMKPWMLATTITILELQKLGFGTDHGVDQHFFQRAKAQGKTVEGLETVEYQLNLFDSLSAKTQEQFLLQTLDEIDILEQQTHQLVNSWTHGQIEGLEVMLENMKKFPEVYEALITQRNNNWLPHFESYLQKHETAMIVVGTLHLLGKQGLLAMLQEKGYVIKQL